jgi:short-subunit dehydrogenase
VVFGIICIAMIMKDVKGVINMINPMDLTGQKVLVTGASSGIGKATSIQLSKLGAKVVMIARREDKLKETFSLLEEEGHLYYSFDLSNVNEIENFMKQIVYEFGSFSGFVHCAGIGNRRPMSMLKYENMLDVMKINYYAFVEIVRELFFSSCIIFPGIIRSGA